MQKSSVKVFLTVLIIILGLGAAYFALRSVPYFDIAQTNVNVVGQVNGLTPDASRIVRQVKEKNIFEISTLSIRKQLSKCFGVDKVTVKRFFPDTVEIEVEYKNYLVKIQDTDDYFMADEKSLYQVDEGVFGSFSGVRTVEINPDYCLFLRQWGYDEGFFRASHLIGNVKSNLISHVKYDNNNGNDYGRLIVELKPLGIQLYICDPVTPERADEAIEYLKSITDVSENNSRYDLFSDMLVKRS